MAHLVSLVIHDPGKVGAVTRAWIETGVTGLTLLDSTGWIREAEAHDFRDDIPLMPSVRGLLRVEEERSRTIFSVVDEDFDIDALIQATESVIGRLDEADNGILFVTPVTRVVGLKPKPGAE